MKDLQVVYSSSQGKVIDNVLIIPISIIEFNSTVLVIVISIV